MLSITQNFLRSPLFIISFFKNCVRNILHNAHSINVSKSYCAWVTINFKGNRNIIVICTRYFTNSRFISSVKPSKHTLKEFRSQTRLQI